MDSAPPFDYMANGTRNLDTIFTYRNPGVHHTALSVQSPICTAPPPTSFSFIP